MSMLMTWAGLVSWSYCICLYWLRCHFLPCLPCLISARVAGYFIRSLRILQLLSSHVGTHTINNRVLQYCNHCYSASRTSLWLCLSGLRALSTYDHLRKCCLWSACPTFATQSCSPARGRGAGAGASGCI